MKPTFAHCLGRRFRRWVQTLALPVALAALATCIGATSVQAQPFVPTASMHVGRADARAVTLEDGRVLVTGGRAASGASLTDAEIYDPWSETWTITGANLVPRQEHTATLLHDGRVLAIGGVSAYWECSWNNTAEIFDPQTGVWSAAPDLPTPVGSGHLAVRLRDGRVLVAGGGDRCGGVTAIATLWDPVTNQWSITGNMLTAREFATAVTLPDGRVMAIGGVGAAPFAMLRDVELYDPALGVWTSGPPLTIPRATGCGGFVEPYAIALNGGSTILVAAGLSGSCLTGSFPTSAAERLNGTDGPWTPVGPMTVPRAFATLSAVGEDGRLLAVGGDSGNGPVSSAEIFSSSTNTWTTIGSLMHARSGHASATLLNGNVLIVGGWDASGQVRSTAEIFRVMSPTPRIEILPSTLSFGTQRVGTTSAARAAIVRNTGDAELLLGSFDSSVADFAAATDCGPHLVPGAECTIDVRFSPSVTGTRTGVLTIRSNASGNPHSVALSGSGIGVPHVRLATTAVAFGTHTVGTSVRRTVALTNTGTEAVRLTTRTISGADFSGSDDCGAVVQAGGSCTITLTFRPSGAGVRPGTFTLVSDAPNSPHAIALTGTGGIPAIRVSPSQVNFGAQFVGTTSAAIPITLSNAGDGIASLPATGAFAISNGFNLTHNCGKTIAPGAHCTILVRFAPVDLGTTTGSLRITSSAAGSPHRVTLTGTGQAGPCGVDVTNRTTVIRGLMNLIPFSRYMYSQTITVSNRSTAPLSAPLFLVLDNLRSVTNDPVYVMGSQLVTRCGSPNGSPLLLMSTPVGGLAPGQNGGVSVIFSSAGWGVSYTTRVISGQPRQ